MSRRGVRALMGGLVSMILVAAVRLSAQIGPDVPRITFVTTAGRFTIETYPLDAPVTVAHILDLVKRGFYNGQRVHRALPGFVVQFGDPQTRDESMRERWGRGAAAASGKPIGVAEIVLKRTHQRGAVGMAHLGEPAKADSQIYITLQPRPDLDGQYAVFARVIDGEDVPARLRVGDLIMSATVEE
jgi:dolichyl-diphosphooligosaccharide---protein glycosyltransferase